MIIYIVRHGQTAENLQMILQGHLPGTLTDKGKEQVRNAAEHLAEKDVQFKCIVSSDLKRAMDSANIISERLKLPVFPMEILRERDWGKYTGMPVSEAADKYKKDGKWMFPDGGAETEEDIYQRAGKALQKAKWRIPETTLLMMAVVGGSIGAWLGMKVWHHRCIRNSNTVFLLFCFYRLQQ